MTRTILTQARRMFAPLCAIALLAGACLVAGPAHAGHHNHCTDPACNDAQCSAHHGCCAQCGKRGCELVTCTIMVPVTITETRVKNCVVKKQVEREQTYTVFQRVADDPKKYDKVVCYLDDEVVSKPITVEKFHLVDNPVLQSYRVKVPVCEERTEMVQTERCIDGQMVLVEEPCTTTVMREREEVRTNWCERPQLAVETTKCTIDYVVKVPKTYKVPCLEETVYKVEPVLRKRKVTACVPTIERRTYDVQVTKMYPQTVCYCQHCAAKLRKKCSSSGCEKDDGPIKSQFAKLKKLVHH